MRKLIVVLAAVTMTAAGTALALPAGAAPGGARGGLARREDRVGEVFGPGPQAAARAVRHPDGAAGLQPSERRQDPLAVSRIKHTSPAPQYQGIILTNPGGPGGSGLDLNAFLVPVLQRGPDQRQGGRRRLRLDRVRPARRRLEQARAELRVRTTSAGTGRTTSRPARRSLHTWLTAIDRPTRTACAAQYGRLLDHMTTIDTARDMDSIRAALGQKQISYYGFSYGTYLGQVYATLFPSHVRRLIMDSNVDPRRVWYQANLDQDVAFNRNIKIWFGVAGQVPQRLPPRPHREGGARRSSTAKRRRCSSIRRAAWSARMSGSTSSSRPATTSRPGWSWAARSRTGSTTRRLADDQGRCTTAPTRPATTTGSRSTTPSSAPTRSGRLAGRSGQATTRPSTRWRRSRPGATPGSTRRA